MATGHDSQIKKDSPAEGKGILRSDRSDDAPAWLIQRTARVLRVLFTRLMQDSPVEVTPEMWTVLTRLLARDGQSQSELAEATYRDRPNMTRILAGLDARGLVVRRPDRADRRRCLVYLTPEGRDLVSATAPTAARARDRMYEGLSRSELSDLRRSLRQIEANSLAFLVELEGTEEAPPAEDGAS